MKLHRIAWMVWVFWSPLMALADTETSSLELVVRETAGLRRFGYPVHIQFKLPREVRANDHFRLLHNGSPVAAQFRSLREKGEGREVALDFNVTQGPLEQKLFKIEYGPKVIPAAEPKGGLRLEEGKENLTIRSGNLSYVVPRQLTALLAQVKDGKRDYIRHPGGGLKLLTKEKGSHSLGNAERVTILRRGPLAIGLRFEGKIVRDKERDGGIGWVVEMTFPLSKSWVEVEWMVEDPAGLVTEMLAPLNLHLEGFPTLVDFGADSAVYTTLRKGEAAFLSVGQSDGPAWKVETVRSTEPRQLLAVALSDRKQPAEGWAHSMDRQRCTAVAVQDFGRAVQDEIQVSSEGPLTVVRRFSEKHEAVSKNKRLHFWAHFVSMPVQIGAVTSPQSMMSPLEVQVK